MRTRRSWGAVTAAALVMTALGALPATAAPGDDGLVVRYALDQTSGTVVPDSSGHAKDAEVVGAATWNGGNGFSFSGGASGSGNAIKLPDNLLTGLAAVSVDYEVFVPTSFTSNAYFQFNLGNSATYPNGTGYLFVTGRSNDGKMRGTFANAGYSSEQRAIGTDVLPSGRWKHITYTVLGGSTASPGRSVLYSDGVQVATGAITAMPSDVATSTKNYIGRSAYGADASFQGRIRDFRIYDRELSAADAAARSDAGAADTVASDAAALSLGDTSAVVADLALPTTAAGGQAVTWATDDAAHVAASGAVHRPDAGEPAVTVHLTATVTQRGQSATKTFTVTVPPGGPVAVDAVSLAPTSATIAVGTTKALEATVSPSTATDASITWTSSDPEVATVSTGGVVTAVAAGTATITAQTSTAGVSASAVVTVDPAIPAGQILHYALDESSGTVAHDTSGQGRDGTLVGGATWTSGDGVRLDGTSGHVVLPTSPLAGLTAVSIDFDVRIDGSQTGSYFLYGIGNTSGSNGNGYLFTTGNAYRTAIASGNWSTEQVTAKSSNLARDVWKRVTYTQSGTTGILYEDGVEVARNTNVTLTPGSIGGGVTLANYIGRSLYSADAYLKGNVRDFAVYNRALTPAQVAAGAAAANQAAVDSDSEALALAGVDAVTGDLTLPTAGAQGSTIAWASSDPGVVSAAGAVVRPAFGGPDATVTLTATVTKGGASVTRQFTVTVLADIAPGAKATYDAEHLTVTNIDDVRGNLTLPVTGPRGSAITWTSSSPGVVSATGDVTRPAYGQDAATVTLTATATNGDDQASHAYTATVPALPRTAPKTGYVFSYFTGDTVAGEKIYFAASQGNNALAWTELNGGAATLTSTLGSTGLRDPFLIRSPEGDTFFLIATDLSIGGGTSWDASQRSGSRYIEVWESNDLVHWSAQRHVRVSPSTAGNTWAPEAYYDEGIGAYVVFWASKLYAESDPDHTGSTYNRMMYATTRDFVTFTEPQVWQDPGKSVIDSTVLKDGDTYYRFTKDEAAASGCTDIIQERSTDLLATSPSAAWTLQANCIGKNAGTGGVEGPTIFKANPGDVNGAGFYLFVDEYGGRGYIPLKSPSLANPTWTLPSSWDLPTHPRHGTVTNVTAGEWDQLTGAAAADVTSSVDLTLSAPTVDLGSTVRADVAVEASDGGEVAGDVTITAGDFSTTVTLVDGAATVDLPTTLAAGTHTVRAAYAGYDVVAAGSATAALTVVAPPVDTVAPTVVVSTSPAAPGGLGGWWTSAVTVTATATDAGTPVSGVASDEASVDGAAWAPLRAAGVQVSSDGSHTVRVRATDVAGNVSAPSSATVKIDRTAPKAKATVSGRSVTLTGSDATSGLARLEYRVGSGAWSTYTRQVTLPKQATSLGYRAVDKAGNTSAAASVAVASSSAVSVRVPTSITTASKARATVVVTAATGTRPTGKVTVKVSKGSKVLTTRTATLSGGKAAVTLPRLPAGKVRVVATYAGSTAVLGSSATVTTKVAKARATTKVSLSRTTARPGQKVVARVVVSAPLRATGKVTVKIRGPHTAATRTLTLSSSGRASVTLPALGSGTYTVSVTYAGSATLEAATSRTVSLRVR